MQQKTPKQIQSNLKKKYQIAFRRWLIHHSPGRGIGQYIGADLPVVRKWVNDRLLPDMTWSNYGELWVIDHVVPLRLFDLAKEDELKIAFHYKNIMPLYREDNLYKEGAIEFSIEILSRIPACEITVKLRSVLLKEVDRLKKYLPKQLVRAA